MIRASLCWHEKSCFVADGICVQSIEHPGCVWDAKFLENGDIVTACSDGIVRIWTIDHEKIADTVEVDSYTSQLSQYKISRSLLPLSLYCDWSIDFQIQVLFILFELICMF